MTLYLTEKFIDKHPTGTRIRHPLYGTASIVKVEPSHLVVEWDSPMARIEQSDRIDAADVIYLSRIGKASSESERVNTRAINFNESLRGSGR